MKLTNSTCPISKWKKCCWKRPMGLKVWWRFPAAVRGPGLGSVARPNCHICHCSSSAFLCTRAITGGCFDAMLVCVGPKKKKKDSLPRDFRPHRRFLLYDGQITITITGNLSAWFSYGIQCFAHFLQLLRYFYIFLIFWRYIWIYLYRLQSLVGAYSWCEY